MFCITSESCRRFSLAEILILAAMNVESTHLAAEGQVRSKTAPQRGKVSATQLLRTKVGEALQM
jgi:hypothetical protein